MIICIACDKAALIYEEFVKYPLCREHTTDVWDNPELVDDLAREIYVEYLVQTKKKLK